MPRRNSFYRDECSSCSSDETYSKCRCDKCCEKTKRNCEEKSKCRYECRDHCKEYHKDHCKECHKKNYKNELVPKLPDVKYDNEKKCGQCIVITIN